MTNEFIMACASLALIWVGLYIYGKKQIEYGQKQKRYYKIFTEKLIGFRNRADIPPLFVLFTNILASIPVDGTFVRAVLFSRKQRDNSPSRSVETLFSAYSKLNEDAKSEFLEMVSSFAMTQCYSDVIFG